MLCCSISRWFLRRFQRTTRNIPRATTPTTARVNDIACSSRLTDIRFSSAAGGCSDQDDPPNCPLAVLSRRRRQGTVTAVRDNPLCLASDCENLLPNVTDPECGDLIRGTDGFRKVRVAHKGTGKSGGRRLCISGATLLPQTFPKPPSLLWLFERRVLLPIFFCCHCDPLRFSIDV